MIHHGRMIVHQCERLILLAILTFFVQISVAQAANILIVWPAEEGVAKTKSKMVLQPHEIRKGKILISQDVLPPIAGKQNRRAQIVPSIGNYISLNLFSDIAYDVKVDSINRHANGTVVVSGKLKNHKMRTVIMTIGPDGYLITLQDIKKGLLYRLRGNSGDGSGSVTEIDMKKMPAVIRCSRADACGNIFIPRIACTSADRM